ncbi:hypothetical protein [Spirosoma pomorum]
MAALTLQINSLEALERLIGGDTEMEIDIRRSVVDAFSDKYIKPVAIQRMDGIVSSLIAPAKTELQKEIGKYFTTKSVGGWGGQSTLVLADSHKNIFVEKAKELIDDATKSAIDQAVSEAKTVINERVNKAIKDIQTHIDWATGEERFQHLVNEVAQKKVAALLNKVK